MQSRFPICLSWSINLLLQSGLPARVSAPQPPLPTLKHESLLTLKQILCKQPLNDCSLWHTHKGADTPTRVLTHPQGCWHNYKGADTPTRVLTHLQECWHSHKSAHIPTRVLTHLQGCWHTYKGADTLTRVLTHVLTMEHFSHCWLVIAEWLIHLMSHHITW